MKEAPKTNCVKAKLKNLEYTNFFDSYSVFVLWNATQEAEFVR